ncbi:phosphoribosylanthranilate isomerase [Lentibacillus sediminis]|uniref:phosphoribosylanthranilate isomerase n=1 Tax=Lentibacillus sediminis TaxID=1940529 RepID=UPI000C1BDDE6|nr:phosphoribosylanthranilate isomerase [Lentibacillus sediminis]
MLVKICGITTREAAKAASEAGADFIGFVFAPSKRQITPEKAATIAASLPSSVRKVGVFVNEDLEQMIETAEQVGLDVLQLHGDEPAEMIEQLPYPTIKAFPADPAKLADLPDYPSDFYLVDSPFGKNRGGNGTTFDWQMLNSLQLDKQKLILAGGLNPENIQEAINQANPACVDVSSGVETNGEKDHEKIRRFIDQAKHTNTKMKG